MSLKFQRTIENFTCLNCQFEVTGDGYTNHCPQCLWGRHVDRFPGDRLETCRGMMRPVSLEKKGDAFIIIQKCVECEKEFRVKAQPNDNLEIFFQK